MSQIRTSITLSPDLEARYVQLLSRDRRTPISVEEILRMGAESLLGIETTSNHQTMSPEEHLRSQRAVVKDLEERLAQETSKLKRLQGMLLEYQKDKALVEAALPILERQVLQLRRALGLKRSAPLRFVKEEGP